MMKLSFLILLFIKIETSTLQNVDEMTMLSEHPTNNFTVVRNVKSQAVSIGKTSVEIPYFSWGRWGSCKNGQKRRRRHCVMQKKCSGNLFIQIKRCKNSENWIKQKTKRRPRHRVLTATRRQLEPEVRGRISVFSEWSAWSECSRKCLTSRRRYCIMPALCGRRIIRQSAYCYVEGSYCQLWIQAKTRRRQEQDYTTESALATPAPAFHAEDSRPSGFVGCGMLGRYRGVAGSRTRYRMGEMMRIIGGRPAAPGKWPWQVAVLNRYKESFCGGTLVSLRWVVTAAHCVRRRLYIRLGEHDLFVRSRTELEMLVTEAIVHPAYDPDTVINDVAMLRLPFPARPNLGHGIACLPSPTEALAPHTSCVILGWGKKRATDVHGTRLLHEAQVSTIEQGVCRRSYWQYAITDNMVCAGRGRRDSCAGDSGGPLLCRTNYRYYLQGITSFGDGCGKKGKYGIYTRTSGYVPWMRAVMATAYFDD